MGYTYYEPVSKENILKRAEAISVIKSLHSTYKDLGLISSTRNKIKMCFQNHCKHIIVVVHLISTVHVSVQIYCLEGSTTARWVKAPAIKPTV